MAEDDPGQRTGPVPPATDPHDDFAQVLGADAVPDAPEPAAPKRGLLIPLLAVVLAVVALVLAFVPYACFAAGLPALAAIVLGFVGLVGRGRRALAGAGLVIGAVALVTALTVSVLQITGSVSRFAADAGKVVSQLPGGGATAAPGLSAGVHEITYAVTGDGRATISYSALVDGRSGVDRESGVPVPHSRTQRVTVERGGDSAQFVMVVVVADMTKATGCSIAIDGKVVSSRSSGASAGGTGFVTCTARTGA